MYLGGAATDPRLGAVKRLHEAYEARQLRILVGAGTSIPSGFPNWEQLNTRLLEGFLRQEQLRETGAQPRPPSGPAFFQELAKRLYAKLGREGAADFVRVALTQKENGSEEFIRILADALYQNRTMQQLVIRSAHRVIAVMAAQARIYTTNFDSLLEMALIDTGYTGRVSDHRLPGGGTAPFVEHIHGWIDPDGTSGGDIIIAESQYFELAATPDAIANVKLAEVFQSRVDKETGYRPTKGATLIVGMSLADANLRRILYSLSRRVIEEADPIYAAVQEDDPLLLDYASRHWRQRKVNLIQVHEYAEITSILRDIKFGIPPTGAQQAWVGIGADYLQPRHMLADDWQRNAHKGLCRLRERVRTVFALTDVEVIQVSVLAPLKAAWLDPYTPSFDGRICPPDEYQLYPIASTRVDRTSEQLKEHASRRVQDINRNMQRSIAGVAFVSGSIHEVVNDGDGFDLEALEPFKRDWRSALALPVLAPRTWVPCAVLFLTSNRATPFWKEFGPHYNAYFSQLINELDEATRHILLK